MIVVLQTIRQTAAAIGTPYPNSLCRYSGLLLRECCSLALQPDMLLRIADCRNLCKDNSKTVLPSVCAADGGMFESVKSGKKLRYFPEPHG